MSDSNSTDRPKGFVVATCVVILRAIIGFIAFTPAYRFGFLAAIASGTALIYFFWRGKNWARIVVLILCVVNILLLLIELPKHDPIRTTRNAIEAILAVFLLYWLNTSPVRTYYQRVSGRGII